MVNNNVKAMNTSNTTPLGLNKAAIGRPEPETLSAASIKELEELPIMEKIIIIETIRIMMPTTNPSFNSSVILSLPFYLKNKKHRGITPKNIFI